MKKLEQEAEKTLLKEEKMKFKPIPSRSPFARANEYGQIPKNCIFFNFCGKHCYRDYDNPSDCIVLNDELCEKYKKGIDCNPLQ